MSGVGEFELHDDVERYRRLSESLARQLRQAKSKSADLVRAVTEAARDAVLLEPLPVIPMPEKRPAKGQKVKPEVALWHLTDWQGSKVTPSYDSTVMKERVLRFVDKAFGITDIQRAHHPVEECVVVLGGDMVEGLFNFPTQVFEVDATIFGQYVAVSQLLTSVVRAALAYYRKVTVVPEWGNHGRIGSKRDNVPKADNLDRMVYELSRQVLAGESRLTWEDCPEDIQRLEIGNYRALVVHGDEVGRNGYVSPQQFQNHCNKWKAGGYPWEFRDVYVGHYHRHGQEPLADGLGSIFWTGSTESDNRYARDGMAVSAVPSQRLSFIDPEKGRVSATYQVWVDG